jgi:hypothetical protein
VSKLSQAQVQEVFALLQRLTRENAALIKARCVCMRAQLLPQARLAVCACGQHSESRCACNCPLCRDAALAQQAASAAEVTSQQGVAATLRAQLETVQGLVRACQVPSARVCFHTTATARPQQQQGAFCSVFAYAR